MPKKGATTTESKAFFLAAIRRGMKVTQAARYARVDRTTPYDWEATDPAFASTWEAIRAARPRMLVDTAFDVALEGNVAMLRFMIHYQREQRQQHDDPKPIEIRIIRQEVQPDGTYKDFITPAT
jgi:hypothetical protein